MRALALCALLLAACTGEGSYTMEGTYQVTSTSFVGSCDPAGTAAPLLMSIELLEGGKAVTTDADGQRVTVLWSAVPGGVKLEALKISGWGGGSAVLTLSDDGDLVGSIDWTHGDSVCQVSVVADCRL